MEQRKALLESLEVKYGRSGNRYLADDYKKRIEEIDKHISNIKNIIVANLDQPDEG